MFPGLLNYQPNLQVPRHVPKDERSFRFSVTLYDKALVKLGNQGSLEFSFHGLKPQVAHAIRVQAVAVAGAIYVI